MTVVAVIGTVVSGVVFRAASDFTTAATSAQAHAELTAALDRIDRELREIPLRSGGGTRPDVSSLTPTSIAFANGKQLRLTNTTLELTEPGENPVPLLSGVSAFTLTPFGDNADPLSSTLSATDAQALRRIAVSITLTRGETVQTLRTRVFLRCTLTGSGS